MGSPHFSTPVETSCLAATRCRSVLFVLVAIGAAGFLFGCGPDTGGRVAVSGKVTFRGTPLKTGAIELVSGDGVNQSGAPITDGRYSIPALQGLRPGQYLVRISSAEEQGPVPAGPPGPESMTRQRRELIPSEYNTKTTLTATVPRGGTKKLDFDLK